MRAKQLNLILSFLALAILSGCGKETEEITSASISDYLPLQPGKYITYRLDSLVTVNFERQLTIRSYQEKQVVDAEMTDAMGRRAFRIYRYLRDAAGTQDWVPAGSYMITPLEKTAEVTENNLRFQKLALPIVKDFSWNGNQFLPSEPYGSRFAFNNDSYMEDWEYTYDSVPASFLYKNAPLADVIRLKMRDEDKRADTLTVTGNMLAIPAGKGVFYLRGTATDTIRLTATPSSDIDKLYIYNRTNQPVKLGQIPIPVNGGKIYEYLGNEWTFGYVNDDFIREDFLITDLPPGSRDYAVEKYAKGIGMVYQEWIMWEFIQISGTPNDGNYYGFGVKRTMIDHN